MTVQDQFSDTIRKTQQDWVSVMESWRQSVRKTFAQTENPFSVADTSDAIDQVFDFWTTALEMQREFAKQFVGATAEPADKVRSQAESLAKDGADQG